MDKGRRGMSSVNAAASVLEKAEEFEHNDHDVEETRLRQNEEAMQHEEVDETSSRLQQNEVPKKDKDVEKTYQSRQDEDGELQNEEVEETRLRQNEGAMQHEEVDEISSRLQQNEVPKQNKHVEKTYQSRQDEDGDVQNEEGEVTRSRHLKKGELVEFEEISSEHITQMRPVQNEEHIGAEQAEVAELSCLKNDEEIDDELQLEPMQLQLQQDVDVVHNGFHVGRMPNDEDAESSHTLTGAELRQLQQQEHGEIMRWLNDDHDGDVYNGEEEEDEDYVEEDDDDNRYLTESGDEGEGDYPEEEYEDDEDVEELDADGLNAEDQDIVTLLSLCSASESEAELNLVHFLVLHNVLDWLNLQMRLRNERLGVIDFAIDKLRSRVPLHASRPNGAMDDWQLRGCMWDWLQGFIIIDDLDDPAELEPIHSFVERGGVELATIELFREGCPFQPMLLSILSWCCMEPRFIPRIAATGAHLLAIRFVLDHPQQETADVSMSLLRALTGQVKPVRDVLLKDGLLDCAKIYLKDLTLDNSDLRLRRAFRASSIICRCAERDSSGRARRLIRKNPMVVSLTLRLFDDVLNAGPKGTVLNMSIDPHLITIDILSLASSSDTRKLLLKDQVVGLLAKALKLRGKRNSAMTKDIIDICTKLRLGKKGDSSMKEAVEEVVISIKSLVLNDPARFDENTVKRAKDFVESIENHLAKAEWKDHYRPSEIRGDNFSKRRGRWTRTMLSTAESEEEDDRFTLDSVLSDSRLVNDEEQATEVENLDDGTSELGMSLPFAEESTAGNGDLRKADEESRQAETQDVLAFVATNDESKPNQNNAHANQHLVVLTAITLVCVSLLVFATSR